MASFEKIAMAIVGVALVTTLILPDRQTSSVIGAASNLFTGSIKAAMGR